MKQKNDKKPIKATVKNKKKITISDLMNQDAKHCIKLKKELEKLGIKKQVKDIVKDDPCYRCLYATERKDGNLGPLDRRFNCLGFPRIIRIIRKAEASLRAFSDYNPDAQWNQKGYYENDLIKGLMLGIQEILIEAITGLSQMARLGHLECLGDLMGKKRPECFCCTPLKETNRL